MERLSDTAVAILNALHTERLDYQSEYVPLIEAANRLAAYEDTALEPEEYKRCADAIRKLDIEHMHDLLAAERDGRLVVLPCKFGSTVYRIIRTKDGGGHIASATIAALHLGEKENRRYKKNHQYAVLKVDGSFVARVDTNEFSKTVFLTRKEAEAALKGGDAE